MDAHQSVRAGHGLWALSATIQQVCSENQFRSLVSDRFANLPTTLTGTATYDPPNLGAGATTSTTVAVTSAALGNLALVSFSLDTQGVVFSGYVSAADTVTVRLVNPTAGGIDLGSGTLTAYVMAR